MRIEIGLLGPVMVSVDGQTVHAGSAIQRSVLAALAAHCPDVVPSAELVAMLWETEPPSRAVGNIQTYVAALRRILEPHRQPHQPPEILVRSGPGYMLRLAPDVIDAHRFVRHADAGFGHNANGFDEAATAEFEAALACWRGMAFEDARGPFARAQGEWYTERRLDVLEVWSAAKIRLGQHEEILEPLLQVTADLPLRERLAINLVKALDKCGRTAEALTLCDQAEWAVANELGVKPGPELAALRADLYGRTSSPCPEPHASVLTAPAQLPPAVGSFVGRNAELNMLRRIVDATDTADASRIVILHGEAGSGKTALAVRFAQEVAPRFPDGQLHVDLRGFSPAQQPRRSADALAILLHALGVAPEHVPSHFDQRQACLRTVLADSRTLVFLDNAATAAQVRPLLPGTDGCFVVVTSRCRLRGLTVTDSAAAIRVGALSEPEAIQLLGDAIGHQRVELEPEAARAIVQVCGLLPLPLRIVAERASMRPRQTLTELAEELGVEEKRLDVLSVHDDHDSVRALFTWSYAALSPKLARAFRLLGVFPGPQISADAAATLIGLPADEAQRAMRALADCHMLQEHPSGRYRLGGLLRLYALERFEETESARQRENAVRRLLDWYLQGTVAADRLLAPERISQGLIKRSKFSVPPPRFADRADALRWCELELPNLVPIVLFAATSGFREHASQISAFSGVVLSFAHPLTGVAHGQ